jgi:hypothetical protein
LFSFFHLDLESTQACSHRHNQLKSIYKKLPRALRLRLA